MTFEYRAYYDSDGKITTYTTEKLDGDYIVITAEDYAQCRHDAVVIDGKLVYTHRSKHVTKLTKNKEGGTKCNKYDVGVISDDDQHTFYTIRAYEIKR